MDSGANSDLFYFNGTFVISAFYLFEKHVVIDRAKDKNEQKGYFKSLFPHTFNTFAR